VSIALEEEISNLPALSKAELLTRWRERLKEPPPAHLNKPILVPLLAYRLQEQAFGGLKPAYKRRLRELAESFEQNPGRVAIIDGMLLERSEKIDIRAARARAMREVVDDECQQGVIVRIKNNVEVPFEFMAQGSLQLAIALIRECFPNTGYSQLSRW
jgi:hypothetical protein